MDRLVTIVIPVGPNHAQYMNRAIDSLASQVPVWYCVIVNDTENDLASYLAPEFINDDRIVFIDTRGFEGVAVARNLGLKLVRTPFVVFLDADDELVGQSLDYMLKAYAEGDSGYIYGDWLASYDNHKTYQPAPEYNRVAHFENNQHVVTSLLLTEDVRRVGGFDTTLPGYEDWEFYAKLAFNGICGKRVKAPIMVYSMTTGAKREASYKIRQELHDTIKARYAGMKPMGCCGGDAEAIKAIREIWFDKLADRNENAVIDGEDVLMEYTGTNRATKTVQSEITRRYYKGGDNASHRYARVDPSDVEWLVSIGSWRKLVGVIGAKPMLTPVKDVLRKPAPNKTKEED